VPTSITSIQELTSIADPRMQVNDGLLERKQSNYSLSEAGQARVAAIKESLNAYGDNVAHSDEVHAACLVRQRLCRGSSR